MDETFWSGRRVLITGHTGFKGSWLSLWMRQLDAKVTGYALAAPTEPSLFEMARVGDDLQSVTGDVRDLPALRDVVKDSQAEVVFHLAAQSLVRAGYREPVETYATNVMGTVNLLEAVRESSSVRAVVIVTSDKCYANHEWIWPYRENDPMGGDDPYSSSKGCAELVTAAYRRSFFSEAGTAAVASVRAGNVIGGGDWAADRLVPDIVRGVLAGDRVRIRSPHAVRPWQHVLDPLLGYLMVAERLVEDDDRATWATGWNFGPDPADVRPVGWLVEQLAERWGEAFRWRADDAPQPHEAHLLKLDATQARDRLGWRPRLDLSQALDWLVDWYRVHLDGGDLRFATEAQIRRYRAKLKASS